MRMWRIKMWVICFWGDKRRVQVPFKGGIQRRQLGINETTVICFSHTVRWDETPAACRHTLLQSFCISQGCSMRSGCREELCHYHRNAPLCAFILWIISIILQANACDSSSWGISWIRPAIFFLFCHSTLPRSNTHFQACSAFCIVLAAACVWMCAEFHFMRRHGLSCQSHRLQWSSQTSTFSRTLAVTFLYWGSAFSSSPTDSGERWTKVAPCWNGDFIVSDRLLVQRSPHSHAAQRDIKGEEDNDVNRQMGSWIPNYLGPVWRMFLKYSARSVLTAVYSWHHPITTLTIQLLSGLLLKTSTVKYLQWSGCRGIC